MNPLKFGILPWFSVKLDLFSDGTYIAIAQVNSERDLKYNDIRDQTSLFLLLQEQKNGSAALCSRIQLTELNRQNNNGYLLGGAGQSDIIAQNFQHPWDIMHSGGLSVFEENFKVITCLGSPEEAEALETEAHNRSVSAYSREL